MTLTSETPIDPTETPAADPNAPDPNPPGSRAPQRDASQQSAPPPTQQPLPHLPSVSGDAPAIVTRSLTKRYGNLVALDKLDLTLEKGDVFGFIGPNGAGKSTTMK